MPAHVVSRQASLRVEFWNHLRPKADLAAVGLLLVSLLFLPKGIPGGADAVKDLGGIAALGVRDGSAVALQALGVVLILRATRVVNFGQVQLGAVTALLFFELIHHTQFVLLTDVACGGGCFPHIPYDTSYLQAHPTVFLQDLDKYGYHAWVVANFWLSLLLSFLIAPLVSWLIYMLIIRRFENAPRLIVTVVTLGVAQVLVAIANFLPVTLFQDLQNDNTVTPQIIPDLRVFIPPVVFHSGDFLEVGGAIMALGLLGAFFWFTSTGVAMRGAADNARRAVTLGINVAQLSSLSWLFAGALSGLAAVLSVLQNGSLGTQQSSFQVATLEQVLAAVVIARLSSLPLAVAGAICIEVINQVFFWNYSSPVPFDGALLIIIAGILLLQSSRQSRAEQEASASYLAARESRPIPGELRNLPLVDSALRWFGIIVAILVLGFPFVMSPAQVSLGSVILIYTIIGLSLLVLTGWAGQISLGQFALAAVGGYIAAIIASRTGLFIVLDLMIGAVAGAVVAVLVGLPALRLRGLYLAVATLAFAQAASAVLLNPDALGQFLPSALGRPIILGFDLNDERVYFYVCLLFAVLAAAAVLGLRRSRTARALIAARDNEQAAQSLGINLFKARLEAFALSGFMAAFAGALFAYQEHGVQPLAFAPEESVNIFNIAIIGGLGSVLGPLVGAAYNGIFLLFSSPALSLFSGGVGVLAVLLLLPGGVGAGAYLVRDAWLRRVAVRHRIVVPSLLADYRSDSEGRLEPVAPKRDARGGVVFVPERYRFKDQWEKLAEESPVRG